MKKSPNKETVRAALVNARYWMGELHGWLWHHAKDGPMRKALIPDIKRMDRIIKRMAV